MLIIEFIGGHVMANILGVKPLFTQAKLYMEEV